MCLISKMNSFMNLLYGEEALTPRGRNKIVAFPGYFKGTPFSLHIFIVKIGKLSLREHPMFLIMFPNDLLRNKLATAGLPIS